MCEEANTTLRNKEDFILKALVVGAATCIESVKNVNNSNG